ncbi:hypothetical protein L195_g056808, partial [Trifolium pratense]
SDERVMGRVAVRGRGADGVVLGGVGLEMNGDYYYDQEYPGGGGGGGRGGELYSLNVVSLNVVITRRCCYPK